MTNLFQNLVEQEKYIKSKFGSISSSKITDQGMLILFVSKDKIVKFLTFLRDDESLSFKLLLDVFGIDMLGVKEPRFEVAYNLLSLKLNNRITVKVELEDGEKINTVSEVFNTANWLEREAFDMFGIEFENHPDLRRILTDYNFEGHPLRKDFPLTGYQQITYNEKNGKVEYEPVNLRQEYRDFDFEMPWQGTDYQIKNQDSK